jgi:hypothetical protein
VYNVLRVDGNVLVGQMGFYTPLLGFVPLSFFHDVSCFGCIWFAPGVFN